MGATVTRPAKPRFVARRARVSDEATRAYA
jgi:hypothetical protein